jgi:hypothetical protein
MSILEYLGKQINVLYFLYQGYNGQKEGETKELYKRSQSHHVQPIQRLREVGRPGSQPRVLIENL